MLINVKMPTIVGILTFMSMMYFMLSLFKHKKFYKLDACLLYFSCVRDFMCVSLFVYVLIKGLDNPLVPKHRIHYHKTFIFDPDTNFGKSNRKQGLNLC